MLQSLAKYQESFIVGIKFVLILIPLIEFPLQRTQMMGSFHSKENSVLSTSHESHHRWKSRTWVSENEGCSNKWILVKSCKHHSGNVFLPPHFSGNDPSMHTFQEILPDVMPPQHFFFFWMLSFIFFLISWRLIALQYCSGFCHTLTWISHEFTCIPHPDPPSHLPLHPIPLGLPSAPGSSTCLMNPTWAGDLFHPR